MTYSVPFIKSRLVHFHPGNNQFHRLIFIYCSRLCSGYVYIFKMMSDASDMLAAALEQMDGIIAGSKALEYSNGIFDCQSPTSPFMGSLRVLHLVEDLRGLLELMEVEEKEGLRCQIPDSTAETVVEWLQGHVTNGHISVSSDVYQERLTHLESDKESLVLQVSVLTDQVEAQGEKIRDLDFCLEEHREKLNATEEMLQQELLSRSALETQKLDHMAEISNLKLKLTTMEKDRLDFEERFRDSESLHNLIYELRDQMETLEVELVLFQEKRSQYGDQEGLIQEINELRFTITDMENERLQYEKKLKSTKSLMAKLSSLKIMVGQMQYEKQRMEHKSQTLKDELVMLKDKLEQKDGEVKRLWDESLYKITSATGGSEKVEKDLEVQKMKRAVESLMAANEEKDRKIEELRQSLNRYKKVQDMVMSAQVKKDKLKEGSSEESQSDSSVSVSTAISVSIDSEKCPSPVATNEEEIVKTPDEIPVEMHKSVLQVSIPALASSRKNSSEQAQSQEQEDWGLIGSEMSGIVTPDISSIQETSLCDSPVTSSMDNLKSSDTDKNPVVVPVHQKPTEMAENFFLLIKNKAYEEISKFSALPLKPPGQSGSVDDESFGSRKARASFGRGFFKIKGSKRTASAPNLGGSLSFLLMDVLYLCIAETEKEGSEHIDLAGMPHRSAEADGSQTSPSSPDSKKKARGIKKLFGKLKRSQSTTFNPDDMSDTEFKRGGVRATAGPRLGWSQDLQHANSELDMPFAKWTKEQVCNWLQEQGLGLNVNFAKRWIMSGQTLLQASQQDLERELGIKHPLHRKKLQLALQALGSEEDDRKGRLDFNWVTRWLDDIGLPQYKTQFDEGRVDGRMLHYMTVDDLLSLKVGSVLHHLSIKRAIQVLRINNFEPNCLRRRPSDENNITPAEIAQWTNHRVMEWLRSVDLAEYAPNLRGSGVLEPRFNVETMALLLNIPPNKTLLRRHLATHFNLLIGQEAQQQKQESVESPDYTLLTATAKVKPRKLAFGTFGSLRKKKQEDSEEYVCPMDVAMPTGSSFQNAYKRGMELRLYDDDLDHLEQMEDSEGTVRQIGAFSEGINNLTSMLKDEEFFKELSTCSPSASVTDEDSNV
ncbi:liprin-beta-1-like isoform X1 [Acipenser oxyrinchus oxyrinchus]|uniref:Liprin-beta-1-like isoform X1 n=1 Tax=Acipenser oxyrinchus oxyrinchus TaxID=40147 RepID=A0AAD8G430_ACIOX|nr:liprin-beta-1-like isoform X1 [Acipenser oxyrinchus oxyrinchus]